MRFDKLSQTLAAGVAWTLNMSANDFQVVSAFWPLTVAFYRGGAEVGRATNVLAGDYARGIDFDRVDITTATAQDVVILLSDGESGSNRVVGEVSVINGELQRVRANQAFILPAAISASPGNYSALQLWNPADSGVNVFVNNAVVMVAVAGAIDLRYHNAALSAGTATGRSKRQDGANSAVIAKNQALAATVGAGVMTLGMAAAYESKELPFSEPFMVPPGYGLIFNTQAVNVSMWATFQWIEEAI